MLFAVVGTGPEWNPAEALMVNLNIEGSVFVINRVSVFHHETLKNSEALAAPPVSASV